MTGVQTCALPICFPVTIGFAGFNVPVDLSLTEFISVPVPKVIVELSEKSYQISNVGSAATGCGGIVGVTVGVGVKLFVGVMVGVGVKLFVGVMVGVTVCVGVGVKLFVGVTVFVGVIVGVNVGVNVGVTLGVGVKELVGVGVGVLNLDILQL